ncbi:MAG: hypothetical protein JSS83_27365 [Cyanobacteria bacterium SZAS LIN-3]|nr:hypothetical protein [Cyanobacteria bacterium SZAS LIN-3]
MKNKFIAFLLAVTATLSISTAAFAQGHGYRGGHDGFRGGQVYHGPVYHDNRGWDRGYDHRGWDRGWDRGYDHRGWDRGRGNWGRDFGLGFGLGYLLAPRYYGPSYYYTPRYYAAPPVYVAPAPQLYIDQYGREYYLDINGYAVFTGRRY